jgi:hypothetical protein
MQKTQISISYMDTSMGMQSSGCGILAAISSPKNSKVNGYLPEYTSG